MLSFSDVQLLGKMLFFEHIQQVYIEHCIHNVNEVRNTMHYSCLQRTLILLYLAVVMSVVVHSRLSCSYLVGWLLFVEVFSIALSLVA
jgi:hypothetical protein